MTILACACVPYSIFAGPERNCVLGLCHDSATEINLYAIQCAVFNPANAVNMQPEMQSICSLQCVAKSDTNYML